MNYDHDRGDWEHECKRDKNLERIAALEAERDRLRALLRNAVAIIDGEVGTEPLTYARAALEVKS